MAITVLILGLVLFVACKCVCEYGAPVPVLGPYFRRERDLKSGDGEGLRVFLLSLTIRAGALLAMLFAMAVALEGKVSVQTFIHRLNIWDAGHYVNLVDLGYKDFIEDGQHLFLVFFPFYVWVTRLVHLVVPSIEVSGLIVSILSYAVGSTYLYKLTAKLFNGHVAWDAVVLMSAFPFSFFFGTVMTESMFLLTCAGAMYYAVERRWGLYAVFGIAAALTRMTGLLVMSVGVLEFLGPYAPFESLGNFKKALVAFLKRSWLLLSPALGTLIYFGLNYYVDGDPFAFVKHQEHWSQGFKWVPGVVDYIIDGVGKMDIGSWTVWIPSLACFVLSFVLLFFGAARREMPSSLAVFGTLYFISNYCLSWLLSAGRYMSCSFVAFIIAALLLEERPRLKTVVVMTGCMLFGVFFVQYLKWAYIM